MVVAIIMIQLLPVLIPATVQKSRNDERDRIGYHDDPVVAVA